MNPLFTVLIVGFALHVIIGVHTRTPEDDQTPLRWKTWHTVLASLASTTAIAAAMVVYFLATGVMLPYWALLLAADVLTLAWKLRKHRRRVRERRTLQALFDRPSLGEGA